MFSFRDEFGQWDPKNQRPELWDLYNGRTHLGESIRVFPLSNWTELDIWGYIAEQDIAIPALYLARERHLIALKSAARHLDRAGAHAAQSDQMLDLFAEELRLAQTQLATITGAFSSDDLLGVIFSRFCIGK